MADELLSQVRENLDKVTADIARSKNIISLLKDAGEDTTKLSQDLRSLEIRKDKWENALKMRGS